MQTRDKLNPQKSINHPNKPSINPNTIIIKLAELIIPMRGAHEPFPQEQRHQPSGHKKEKSFMF